ncbi:MAG: hypothetical protein Q9169_006231 [Polycauliona sp. 2 TL-2023]
MSWSQFWITGNSKHGKHPVSPGIPALPTSHDIPGVSLPRMSKKPIIPAPKSDCSLPQTSAPSSWATNPHFKFKFSAGEPIVLHFERGMARMAILIRDRHDLDPNPNCKSKDYATLTSTIQKFSTAFTLDRQDYFPEDKDGESYDPEKRDENLLRSLEGVASVIRHLRGLEIAPSAELQAMMGLIMAALKGFSEDQTRLKQWLELESHFDVLAKEMMGSKSEESDEEDDSGQGKVPDEETAETKWMPLTDAFPDLEILTKAKANQESKQK